jgi:hypothetical protein
MLGFNALKKKNALNFYYEELNLKGKKQLINPKKKSKVRF